MIESPTFLSYPKLTDRWSEHNLTPRPPLTKAAVDAVAATDRHLAYSNAGSILSPFFDALAIARR